ncbi:ABC-2 transporter permease [Ruminiclostridium cellobioparum]|jgi:ABC-2 type transport system permease protein|uniref:ABC-2 transporter permease n=1 Tax=Ruminiclostridium cellobioparum TaxID=29355 RepID=UPI000484065D|nr:ABC-2 transporter permease [Ruminiclostridium cellobioparum]
MNNVIKMIKLDISLIKPYSKSLLIVFLVPLIVIFGTQDIISGVIFCMSIMAMTSSYTFSIAEKNDLNRLYGLLPVTKRDIVTGRYMFSALTGVIAVLFGVVMNVVILTFTKKSFSYQDTVIAVSVGLMLYTLFTAIQLPGFFKFGAIKGRFITFIPFIGMFLVGVIAKGVSPENLQKIPDIAVLNNVSAFFAVSILLDIVIYGISMGFTQKLYDGMEL